MLEAMEQLMESLQIRALDRRTGPAEKARKLMCVKFEVRKKGA